MAEPDSKKRSGRLLRSSASGASFLIAIQLASRLFTFAANQLILRKLSPAVLGIATQLELYLTTILYFSRESVRVAIQRQPLNIAVDNEDGNDLSNASMQKTWTEDSVASQSVVNISYLSVGLGIPLTMALTAFYKNLTPTRVAETPYYDNVVATTGTAALLELSIEPFFAVIQQHALYKQRAIVEMSAALAKSSAVCGTFIWASKTDSDVGAFPFALGHVCHALVLICGYAMTMRDIAREKKFSFLPTRMQLSKCAGYLAGMFSYKLISLSANVFLQTAVKHLLTQGDSMILAAMSSLEDQGIYSLASNYGGLVARIIFQPIEESSRTLFSSLLSPRSETNVLHSNVNVAKMHLVDILRAYGLLSIVIFPLAPSLVPQILHLLGGQRWISDTFDRLLTMYCYYVPFLAFNGITEAFVSSVANSIELRRQTGLMGAFSASFVVAAYIFLEIGNMGAQGLLWANIVNMMVRTVWSYLFIRSYLHRHRNELALVDFAPRLPTQIVGTVVTSIILAKSRSPNVNLNNIIWVMAFNATYVLLVLFLEREYFLQLYRKLAKWPKQKL